MGAGQAQVVAQEVGQQAPHRHGGASRRTVHGQRYLAVLLIVTVLTRSLTHAACTPLARRAAVRAARAVSTSTRWPRYSAVACRSSSVPTRSLANRPAAGQSARSTVLPASASVRSSTIGVPPTAKYAARTWLISSPPSRPTVIASPHIA